MKMENLNAQELSSQLTDGKAERADLAGDSGSDDSCRKPPCVQLAAEYEEARNRFQQTVQKLNIKLEKAEKSAKICNCGPNLLALEQKILRKTLKNK